jgi:two-component SAPR family response regulator
MDVTESPRKLELLVLDDEVLVALMIAEQLGEFGFKVAGPAHTLQDGRRLATDAPIDGALLDINLGKDGLSSPVADILIARKIPFLFVSGYNHAPEERFRQIPFFSKPFTMGKLALAVDQMLAPAKG